MVKQNKGNWLESKLSHLAGKFAGIIEVSVEDGHALALKESLQSLENQGMAVAVELSDAASTPATPATHKFSIVGNDRPGIIREISQSFANQGINVIELNSKCSSAPHVGTPLFEAWGKMNIPSSTDIGEFESALDKLCDQLAVDLQFDEV